MGDIEKIWERRARRVTRRINAGWFFQKAAPLWIGGSCVFAVIVLLLRTLRPQLLSVTSLFIGGVAALMALSLVAFLLARKRFIGRTEGLVRLDDRLSLNNSLSTAEKGLGPWPDTKDGLEPDNIGKLGLRWNLPALLLPILVMFLVVAAALLVPVWSLQASAGHLPPKEPGAWKQMEEWLTALEEENLIDEKILENTRDKIDELRQQPEDEWFSHNSMEATDSLRDAMARDLQEAARDLAALERDLSALENYSGKMSEAAKEMLMKEYDEALKNLGLNHLQLNQDLMKQLANVDLSQLSREQMNQISKEQLQKLQEKLRGGSKCLGDLEGLPSLGESESLAEMMERLGPGKGGVERGRGDAPIFFGDKEQNLKTNNIEGISNQDLDRALPGEVLSIGETRHDSEKIPSVRRAGGALSGRSGGGDAVWRDSLMPSEKALLKRYFK